MLGSQILEVTIGVIFVFILISIICSAIREGIEAWMKTRAAFLEQGIRELLHDKKGEGLAKSFFHHPQNGSIEIWNHILSPILGWLLTALAATMGAPFWFDILNKVMVRRRRIICHIH